MTDRRAWVQRVITIFPLLLISIIGLTFVFLTPPFQSPDEQTHLYRAYQLSEGQLFAQKLPYGAGGVLPASLSASFQSFRYILFDPSQKVTSELLQHELTRDLAPSRTTDTRFENTAPYGPAGYVPQILGIGIGRLFDASPVILLYLARLCNLAVWIGALAWAMKRATRLQVPFFILGLVPIVAFQASSASADVVPSALSLILIAEVVRANTRRVRVPSRLMIGLVLIGVCLALCKIPYVLIVLALLMLPHASFLSKRDEIRFKIIAVGIPLLISLGWLVVSYHTFVNLKEGVDSIGQIRFILAHPLHFMTTLLNSFVFGGSDGFYLQLVGQLGWLDTKIPFWSVLLSVVSFLLAAAASKVRFGGLFKKRYLFVIFILLAGLITGAIFLTYNSVGAHIIDGLQGRYFVPLYGIVIVLLSGLIPVMPHRMARFNVMCISLACMSMVGTIASVATRYYGL